MNFSLGKLQILLTTPLLAVTAGLFGCGGGGAPAPADTAVGMLENIVERLQGDEQTAVWDALPAGMQNEVNGLVRELSGKMDPEMWDTSFDLTIGILAALKDKKEFVLGHPMVAMTGISKEKLEENYDPIMDLLTAISQSGIAELSDLESFDGRTFLTKLGPDLIPQIKGLLAMTGQAENVASYETFLKGVKFELKESEGEGETTTVVLRAPESLKEALGGMAEETEFVRVEGKWVPASLMSEWPSIMENARRGLAEMNPEELKRDKEQFLIGANKITEMLSKIEDADTQEEFNAAIMSFM
ncbi:MAG: hypothetical protein JKY61_06350 [Planctomycetes bacterium]|nr:hypothetical protein [Planctomycetota bacterium]